MRCTMRSASWYRSGTVHTVLTGLLNRSALYGALADLEALGLDLLEIRWHMPKHKSPESGDSR